MGARASKNQVHVEEHNIPVTYVDQTAEVVVCDSENEQSKFPIAEHVCDTEDANITDYSNWWREREIQGLVDAINEHDANETFSFYAVELMYTIDTFRRISMDTKEDPIIRRQAIKTVEKLTEKLEYLNIE